MDKVDQELIAALEEELNRKIVKFSQDADLTYKKIVNEKRRCVKKGQMLEKQQHLTIQLYEDLVGVLQKVDELRAAVNTSDLRLLRYQKHTQHKGSALDVLQRLTDVRIQRVLNNSKESSEHAAEWLKSREDKLKRAYNRITNCVVTTQEWLQIWPLIHLWLSREHYSTQSIYATAELKGLVGQLVALSRYASVIKLKHIPDPNPPASTDPQSALRGVSIKPFTVKPAVIAQPSGDASLVPRPIMLFSDRYCSGGTITTSSANQESNEGAVAVRNLIRRVNHQVGDDNSRAKSEMLTLAEEIKSLQETKATNAKLLNDLCIALSMSSDQAIKEVQTEVERILTGLDENVDNGETAKSNQAEDDVAHTSDRPDSTRKASTPSFSRGRRNRSRKEDDAKASLKLQYEKHGYAPGQRVRRLKGNKRDYILHWLQKFGWERKLPYVFVHKKLDSNGLLDLTPEEALSIPNSPESRHHSAPLHASGRSSSHHSSKVQEAARAKNDKKNSLLRAKLAILESEKIAATLQGSIFQYCDDLCRSGDLVAVPALGVIQNLSLLDSTNDAQLTSQQIGIVKNEESVGIPRRRDVRKMSSLDILSMEGRLMAPVAEATEEEEEEADEDLVVGRSTSEPDNTNDLKASVPEEYKRTVDDISADITAQHALYLEDELIISDEGEMEHVASNYPSPMKKGSSNRIKEFLAASEASRLHHAVDDVFQWINYKDTGSLLAVSSGSIQPAAPEYLYQNVGNVRNQVNASLEFEKYLKFVRKRRLTKKKEKIERRRQTENHVLKTANLYLGAEGSKKSLSTHHWKEISDSLDEKSKYKATTTATTTEGPSVAVNNTIVMREQQRMARKTRVMELSRKLRSPVDKDSGRDGSISPNRLNSPSHMASSIAEDDEGSDYDEDINEMNLQLPNKSDIAVALDLQHRKISVVVNEGSRRSILKTAMVLKVDKVDNTNNDGDHDSDSGASKNSGGSSSDVSSDNESMIHDDSSSDEDISGDKAIHSRIFKNKSLHFKYISDNPLNKFDPFKDGGMLLSGLSVPIVPMYDAVPMHASTQSMDNYYPIALPGNDGFLLLRRRVVLGPVSQEADISIIYQPVRDRLLIEVLMTKTPHCKFRLPIYQNDIESIFPTRPSLKIYDFTSRMMNRYIDALVRLMRMDRMLRRDAYTLALQLVMQNTPRIGTVASSRANSAAPASSGVNLDKDVVQRSFDELGNPFICSLLPDARQLRLDYVNSFYPGFSMPVDVTTKPNSILDHFPQKVEVNVDLTGSSNSKIHHHVMFSVSPPLGASRQTTEVAKTSNLPDIKKKHSVVTVDVNHGNGIFVPSRYLPVKDADFAKDDDFSFLLATSQPKPPPRNDVNGLAPRPAAGGTHLVPTTSVSGDALHHNAGLGTSELLKLVDTTSVLADKLGATEDQKATKPRNNIMPHQENKKSMRKNVKLDPSLIPTAGDIARSMRDSHRQGTVFATERIRTSSAPLAATKDFESRDDKALGSTLSLKKTDFLDTDDYNVDDVVLVFNVRKEGSEAMLVLGALNNNHDSNWKMFL